VSWQSYAVWSPRRFGRGLLGVAFLAGPSCAAFLGCRLFRSGFFLPQAFWSRLCAWGGFRASFFLDQLNGGSMVRSAGSPLLGWWRAFSITSRRQAILAFMMFITAQDQVFPSAIDGSWPRQHAWRIFSANCADGSCSTVNLVQTFKVGVGPTSFRRAFGVLECRRP